MTANCCRASYVYAGYKGVAVAATASGVHFVHSLESELRERRYFDDAKLDSFWCSRPGTKLSQVSQMLA